MTAQKLDGTATAKAIKAELADRVAKLREHGITPGLGTVLVGDDPGSTWYVNGKHKDCAEVGIESIREDLPGTASQDEILAAVRRLNENPACTGYIVQLPLPKGVDENLVLGEIDPEKDADGLHPTNLGWLVLGKPAPLPCTPFGIVTLLRRHDVEINGADVVVVGRGVTVGRPLGLLLTRRSENATVTLCHTGTRDLAAHVRQADIVVAAAGVPGIITGDMVKPGAAVLDVGVSRVDGKLAGDVDASVLRRRGMDLPEPRRRRPDDPRDAALQRGGARRGRTPARWRGEPQLVSLHQEPRRVPSTLGGMVYLIVVAVTAVGLLIVAFGPWRRGITLIGLGLLFGALMRTLLRDRNAGMLRVRRHKWVDVAMLGGIGTAMIVLASVIPNQPG